ncbi:hypothetical protein M2271_004083 [Streptomyces sp. LBL]|nr:hypothetical protein [Streptomyces sp. LBL]
MGLHLLFQVGYLFVQGDQQLRVGGDGGRVGGGDRPGQAELPLAQRGDDRGCLRLPTVPIVPAGTGQDSGDLGAGAFLAVILTNPGSSAELVDLMP